MAHRKIASTARESIGQLAPAFVGNSEDVLFGDMRRREQPSLRDSRSIAVAALVAGGLAEQLPYHLRFALDNGVQPEELAEAVTHLAFYAGWPRAASALEVFKRELGEKAANP